MFNFIVIDFFLTSLAPGCASREKLSVFTFKYDVNCVFIDALCLIEGVSLYPSLLRLSVINVFQYKLCFGAYFFRYMYRNKELVRSKRECIRKLKEEVKVLQQKLER